MLSLQAQGCIARKRAPTRPPLVVPASAGLYRVYRHVEKPSVGCPCKRRVVSRAAATPIATAPLSLQAQGCILYTARGFSSFTVVPASAGLYRAVCGSAAAAAGCPCKRRVVSDSRPFRLFWETLSLQAQGCIGGSWY